MPQRDGSEFQDRVGEIVRRRPCVGLAVGVVREGRLDLFQGHGVADIKSTKPIAEDTVFRVASITKTFTAIAVMQLWEQGVVDLDAPANQYLRAYRLIPNGLRPATVRHLLTHTAGLPEVVRLWDAFQPDFGESFEAGKGLPSLAEFYGRGLRLRSEPGSRFVYNNHGPATLGQIVEDVSGQRLRTYFREHIFEPLGMADSDLVRSERVATRLATGYEFGPFGPKPVDGREMVTVGAASVYSTPADMSRYIAALLGGGANESGSLLEPETIAMMFQPHYQPDPRIPGMGLGFFRYDIGGHAAVGHQGTHPGFHSQVLLAPASGIGVIAFTNGTRQADFWLPSEVSRLLSWLIDDSAEEPHDEFGHHPETWRDICGWYRLSAGLTDVRLRGMLGAGIEVFVRDGQPMIRFLTPIPALARGFPLLPGPGDDPYVYRIEPLGPELEPMRVVFAQGPTGETNRILFDVMPIELEKRPSTLNPRRWAVGSVTAVVLASSIAAARRLRS